MGALSPYKLGTVIYRVLIVRPLRPHRRPNAPCCPLSPSPRVHEPSSPSHCLISAPNMQFEVQFTQNVTPTSYATEVATGGPVPADDYETQNFLFAPGEDDAPEPESTRKKRRRAAKDDHIPRPPNAFMLFRADFVNKGRVPPSIETVHGNLSKIIGAVWRNLPPHEAQFWQVKAAKAKQDHARQHPEYKYRPAHARAAKAAEDAKSPQAARPTRAAPRASAASKVDAPVQFMQYAGPGAPAPRRHRVQTQTPEPSDEQPTVETAHAERRFDIVAKYMLNGIKHEELEAAVQDWEKTHDCETECVAAYSPMPSKKRKVAPKPKPSGRPARAAAARKAKAGSPSSSSSRESSVHSGDGDFEFTFDARSFQQDGSSSEGVPLTPSPPPSYCSGSRSPSPYSASSSTAPESFQHGYYQEAMYPAYTGSYAGINPGFFQPPPMNYDSIPQDYPRRRSSSVPPPTVTAANFQQFQPFQHFEDMQQQQSTSPQPALIRDTVPVFINPFAPKAENEAAPEPLATSPAPTYFGAHTDEHGRRMSAMRTDAIIGAHRRASSAFGYHPEPSYAAQASFYTTPAAMFDPSYRMGQPYATVAPYDTMTPSMEYYEAPPYPSLVAPTPTRPTMASPMIPEVESYEQPASCPSSVPASPARDKLPSFSLESFVDFSSCTDDSDVKPEDN
ncbi:hypothetical protein BD626DRAFT_508736 [Schizophyllum amplum]|uniref:HMG box domain-containing protein n=1 Tax=Schizophyllum amplum TaxID=97359 RepID=A0A550C3H0_9AGAR|nr:hypothetical protein BD626DRAFT_508736 [Auriculariopsis ampla]